MYDADDVEVTFSRTPKKKEDLRIQDLSIGEVGCICCDDSDDSDDVDQYYIRLGRDTIVHLNQMRLIPVQSNALSKEASQRCERVTGGTLTIAVKL